MKHVLTLLLIIASMDSFSQVKYIAHRGASHDAPENTVASAVLAWEQGADAVEIDVHLSKDNRVMVSHDENTLRTSGSDYTISKTTSDELRRLDVGSWKDRNYADEKIPYVEEVIETIPDSKTLVVEIKCGSEVLPALKKAVSESGKGGQIIFISFGWETILATKAAFPGNACYWLAESNSGLDKRLRQAQKAGLDGVDLNYNLINAKLMQKAISKGLDVLAWTVDDPAVAKRLAELGVHGLTTNRPAWLKQQME